MSQYITGQGSQAWAGLEASYGVRATTPAYSLLAMTSESMTSAYNKLQEDTLIGSKTLPDQDLGSVTTSGGVSSILKPTFIDWLATATLGEKSTSTTGGFTVNTYKLAAVDADLPTSEMTLVRGSKQFNYNGLTISSLTLNCTAQDFVKADISFNGCKERYYKLKGSCTSDDLEAKTSGGVDVGDVYKIIAGGTGDTYTVGSYYECTDDSSTPVWAEVKELKVPAADDRASYKCTKAKLFNATANSDEITDFNFSWDTCPAGTVYDVESATVTFDNGLEDTPATYCSGVYANQPMHGQRGVTVQCSVPYSNSFEDFRQTYYASEDPDKLALLLAFCSKEMEGGVPKEQVFIVFPNISITEMSANVSGQGLIDGSFTGTALSIGSTEPVIVTVKHKN